MWGDKIRLWGDKIRLWEDKKRLWGNKIRLWDVVAHLIFYYSTVDAIQEHEKAYEQTCEKQTTQYWGVCTT